MSKELTHKDICPYYEENCIDIGCVCPKYIAYERVNTPGVIEENIQKMGVDMSQGKLHVMMGMQHFLAQKFHEVDGLSKDEIDHWVKEYDICITDEITEVHEHLNVFPNTTPKDNELELQKEFIDIWHFLMDEFIVSGMDTIRLIDIYEKDHLSEKITGDPLKFIFKHESLVLGSHYLSKDNDTNILVYSNLILAGMRAVRQQISWKHWKKPANAINFDKLHSAMVVTFRALVQCFILSGLTPESLYEIYVKKNCENSERIRAGY